MKLKIRGLVFTGFAAAVFAQSAWALPPAAGLTAPEIDALKATVTSKYYVDSNYQDLVERKGTEGTAPNDTTTITSNSTNDQYPTSRNVYKFVKGEIAALDDVANIQGDGTYVTVGEAANGNKEVQIITANLASANSDVTGTLTDAADQGKLVTASAVNSLIDTSITSADSTGSNNSQMPTSKAVYDFVTGTNDDTGFQRKITSSEANALATFNYDTANNVYNDAGKGVMIGYKGNTTGSESEWKVFGAKPNVTTAGSSHLSYLTVQSETDTNSGKEKYLIDIKSGALAEDSQAIAYVGDANATYQNTNKLTTAGAVYDYAVPNQWDSTTQANKTLVTDEYGVVTVSNVPALPEIANSNPCRTEGVHCALVSSADAYGNVSFSWNVMAGAEASGGNSGGNNSNP